MPEVFDGREHKEQHEKGRKYPDHNCKPAGQHGSCPLAPQVGVRISSRQVLLEKARPFILCKGRGKGDRGKYRHGKEHHVAFQRVQKDHPVRAEHIPAHGEYREHVRKRADQNTDGRAQRSDRERPRGHGAFDLRDDSPHTIMSAARSLLCRLLR